MIKLVADVARHDVEIVEATAGEERRQYHERFANRTPDLTGSVVLATIPSSGLLRSARACLAEGIEAFPTSHRLCG
jgi:hypothetical protein